MPTVLINRKAARSASTMGEVRSDPPGSESTACQQEGRPGTWESLSSPLNTGGRPHQPKARRSRVRGGITADDAGDADRILAALRGQRLPVCPTTGSSQPSPTISPVPAPETTAVPQPTEAGPDGSSAVPSTSARTTASSEPGVDCREAD